MNKSPVPQQIRIDNGKHIIYHIQNHKLLFIFINNSSVISCVRLILCGDNMGSIVLSVSASWWVLVHVQFPWSWDWILSCITMGHPLRPSHACRCHVPAQNTHCTAALLTRPNWNPHSWLQTSKVTNMWSDTKANFNKPSNCILSKHVKTHFTIKLANFHRHFILTSLMHYANKTYSRKICRIGKNRKTLLQVS